jgi:hypothetical protein
VLPLWSAAVDPRVLAARAAPPVHGQRLFDASAAGVRTLRGHGIEHLLIDRGGAPIRLDLIAGTALAGPVSLCFELAHDDRLAERLAALRAFATRPALPERGPWQRGLLALHAHDARAAGASLRDIAEVLLGPGDWPGDGDHRKSRVRRMIATGERMVGAGAPAILLEGRRRA